LSDLQIFKFKCFCNPYMLQTSHSLSLFLSMSLLFIPSPPPHKFILYKSYFYSVQSFYLSLHVKRKHRSQRPKSIYTYSKGAALGNKKISFPFSPTVLHLRRGRRLSTKVAASAISLMQ
jgi:hypothetical protein